MNKIAVLGEAMKSEVVLDPSQPLYLRMIEFTTLGYNSHSVYPSLAASLLQSNHFNPSNPTVIFAHGFIDNPLSSIGRSIADAYKRHGNYNILALDASKLIEPLYARSAIMVKYIGEYLGYMVNDMTVNGIDPELIHLVGHSLGAHIVGFAGKAYQLLRPGKILPRITGLDPAGPCFYNVVASRRICSSDARFVDIIHTNDGEFGILESLGSVDFYPNGGGVVEPGCKIVSCSHLRVIDYYVESVNDPENFIGVECKSWRRFLSHQCTHNKRAVMGFAANNSTKGNFYLKTRSNPKYGLGLEGIE